VLLAKNNFCKNVSRETRKNQIAEDLKADRNNSCHLALPLLERRDKQTGLRMLLLLLCEKQPHHP
jgi:hypothetical protein